MWTNSYLYVRRFVCVCLCRGLWIKICIWVAGDHATRLRVGQTIENSFQITSSSLNVLHYALFFSLSIHFSWWRRYGGNEGGVGVSGGGGGKSNRFFIFPYTSEKKKSHMLHTTTLNDDTIFAIRALLRMKEYAIKSDDGIRSSLSRNLIITTIVSIISTFSTEKK